jgi:hypothetical protein
MTSIPGMAGTTISNPCPAAEGIKINKKITA